MIYSQNGFFSFIHGFLPVSLCLSFLSSSPLQFIWFHPSWSVHVAWVFLLCRRQDLSYFSHGASDSKSKFSKKQSKVADLLGHGPRHWQSITWNIIHELKQSQSPLRFKGKGIAPTFNSISAKVLLVAFNFLSYKSSRSIVFPSRENHSTSHQGQKYWRHPTLLSLSWFISENCVSYTFHGHNKG